MTSQLSRRRLLKILAASPIALAAGPLTAAPLAVWRGQALGAHAEIYFAGLSEDAAAPLFERIEATLVRIEMLFSLYRRESALSRLNHQGRLDAPPPEFLEVLALASAAHHATGGLFDPSVQPLFAAHAEGRSGDSAARALIGMDKVVFDADAVRLEPGMALTLNGIAQGFATDRIAALLRDAGLVDVLVDIGEIAALGLPEPSQIGWPVRLPDGQLLHLRDRAIATSSWSGTMVGSTGHIFRPDGLPITDLPLGVSVLHKSAAMADALSTAAAVMTQAEREALAGRGVEMIVAGESTPAKLTPSS